MGCEHVRNETRRWSFEAKRQLCWCRLDSQRVCLIFGVRDEKSLLYNYNLRFEEAVDIKRCLEAEMKGNIFMGISTAFGTDGEIQEKFAEAQKAFEYMAFAGRDKLVFYENIRKKAEIHIMDRLNANFSELQERFAGQRFNGIEEIVARIYDRDIQGMQQYHYLEYVNSLLFGWMAFLTSSCNIPWEKFYEEGNFSIDRLNGGGSCGEMKEMILEKLREIIRYQEEEAHYSDTVKKAIQIINERYQQDISRDSIADEIGVHKSHLSKIFKQETGQSMNTYLNETRIRRAIALMETKQMRTADIVYSVGYNSAQNYYHAFRQVTGMTPKEYREQKESNTNSES